MRDAEGIRLSARPEIGGQTLTLNEALVIPLILIIGGGWQFLIGGTDPSLPAGSSGSIRLQAAYSITYLALIFPALSSFRELLLIIRRNWLLFSLPLLAIFSTLWSPEPELTFRKSIAYLLSFLTAAAIIARFRDRAPQLLVHILVAAVLFSVLNVALLPKYGIHQATDVFAQDHAGQWRGIFVHRTMLGQISALTTISIWTLGKSAIRSTALRWAIISICMLCLTMSESGGGLLTLLICGFMYLAAELSVLLKPSLRVIYFLVAGLLVIVLSANWSDILSVVLNLLNKKASLTGRVPFWAVLQQSVSGHPILGGGYPSWLQFGALAESSYRTMPNAQNVYLDAFLSLGLIGLIIIVALFSVLIFKGYRTLLNADQAYRGVAMFTFLIGIFFAEVGVIESFLTDVNSIFVTIFALAYLLLDSVSARRRHFGTFEYRK